MNTLCDFYASIATASGEFLVHDDGYRTRRFDYGTVAGAARGFAARLSGAGLARGDAVLFWSENRPEWIAAFWGCILTGIVVVPIDQRSSLEFARRVCRVVGAKLVLVGHEVASPAAPFGSTDDGIDSVPVWPLAALDWHDEAPLPGVALARSDVAEIIFTSGATAEPKGVIITHGNVVANLAPIQREVSKHRRWGRPFFPLRFLELLPLSHLFGQAMATFIPPMLPGTVIFMRGHGPAAVIDQIRRRRVSVLVGVPKVLDVLREHLVRTWPDTAVVPPRQVHVARRWWRYRHVHRALGPKFWSLVVGGAALDPMLEEYWRRLGFVVIQGYGLTETAPIVSLNHPFAATRGSVGKALAGTEVRIAADGEILVRGDHVTRGYVGAAPDTMGALQDGWLHTGDIGSLDAEGRLFVRGRKKEMIVTPDGLNVFPEDVEPVVARQRGVREVAVVGVDLGTREHVHAVVVLDPGIDAEDVVGAANRQLADHQRVRGVTVWPGNALPRTEGTGKLRRREIRQAIESTGGAGPCAAAPPGVDGLLARLAAGRVLHPETTLEELGLSSLDRVELLAAIEDTLQTSVDEGRFAGVRSVGDVRALADPKPAAIAGRDEVIGPMPTWGLRRPARWFRQASLTTWVLPLTRRCAHLRIEGLGHLSDLDGPVILAANHQSHMDTPIIYAALPPRLRSRLAVAMSKEFFAAYFHPRQHRWWSTLGAGAAYTAAVLFFNAFPLPQREAGTRLAIRHMGSLADEGLSILIYPEGERSDTGRIGTFRAGIGLMGSKLQLPVVPVRVEGADRVLHRTWRMVRPGPVRVAFGRARLLEGDRYPELAREIENAVRAL